MSENSILVAPDYPCYRSFLRCAARVSKLKAVTGHPPRIIRYAQEDKAIGGANKSQIKPNHGFLAAPDLLRFEAQNARRRTWSLPKGTGGVLTELRGINNPARLRHFNLRVLVIDL